MIMRLYVFAFLAHYLVLAAETESTCIEGWSQDPATGSCFLVFADARMHGNDAKELCRAMDDKAGLAILHTTDEIEFVKNLLKGENLSELDGAWVAENDESQENCSAMLKEFDYELKTYSCEKFLPPVCEIENKN